MIDGLDSLDLQIVKQPGQDCRMPGFFDFKIEMNYPISTRNVPAVCK
jgi:hypothetical protein